MADQPQSVQINVPPEKAAGCYANIVGVWHTPTDFAIDFCVNQPFAGGPDKIAAQVVSRVRIPPSMVFELLRALSENLGEYEDAYGEVKIPGGQEESDA
jgi:hypothetical protein